MFAQLVKTIFPSAIKEDFIPDYQTFERNRPVDEEEIKLTKPAAPVPKAGLFWDYLFGEPNSNQSVDPLSVYVSEQLKQIIRQPGELLNALPVMPNSVSALMSKLQQDDFDVQELLKLIATEPSMAADVLTLANSSRYKRGDKPVTDLQTAFMYMGAEGLKEGVLAAFVRKFSAGSGLYYKQFGQKIWQHSTNVADTAQALCKNQNGLSEASAYVLGLIMNLGCMIIYQLMLDAFRVVDPDAKPSSGQFKLLMKEQSLPLTVLVAEYWQLPQEIINILAALNRDDLTDEATQLIADAELLTQASELIAATGKQQQIADIFLPKLVTNQAREQLENIITAEAI